MKRILVGFLLLVASCWANPVLAQTAPITGRVVTACDASAFAAGSNQFFQLKTTGALCITGTITITTITTVTTITNPVGVKGSDGSAIASTSNPLPTSPSANTSGGVSGYPFEVAASDNHQVVKNGAGTVYALDAFSIHTAAMFIRLYDAGTGFNGCNSATNLMWEGQIPGAPTTAGGGFIKDWPVGRAFTNGLSVCVTGAYGNTNTTAATASVASVNIGYK